MTRSRNTVSPGWSQTARISKGSSIWTWWREGGAFHCQKTATIPPEPAKKDQLPPLLRGFEAVLPPGQADIDLSLDDRFLYVSCWGTMANYVNTTCQTP